MKIYPIRPLRRQRPGLTSQQRIALEALACLAIGLLMAVMLYYAALAEELMH